MQSFRWFLNVIPHEGVYGRCKDGEDCSASYTPREGFAVCRGDLEENPCSFNSLQRRPVVYNRRNWLAVFHLELFPMVAVQGIHLAQVFWELRMESPSLASTCVAPNTKFCLKIPLELLDDPCKGELMSKPQLIITFLNRDNWNQYLEC